MKLLKSYRFWIGISLIALVLMLRYSGLTDYITLENLQEQKIHLQQFVDSHYIGSVLTFIALYILIVMLALPLPALFTLTGGFLFGTLPGVLYSVTGATVGSMIFFLMVRHSLGVSIQKRYKKQLGKFNEQVKKYGTSYLIAIRFIAFIPFFIQNILIGLTNISLGKYLWTTVVGVLPASFVFSYAGRQLAVISSVRDVFSGNVLLAFILLALLGIVPIVVQQRMKN